jgi:F0F1-type ATP synthase gamma subunit
MFKKVIAVFMIIVFVIVLSGCAAHIHKIGKGAQGNDVIEKRQWYILFGLVPLNEVDTAEMAEGATDYTITTEQSELDVIMNIFTQNISVVSRTVTVEK